MPGPINVPVAHMDRMPAGDESLIFTGEEATKWNEHWVAIDVVEARRLMNMGLDFFSSLPRP